MVSRNKLTTEKRAAVIRALVEGSSIRAPDRRTGVGKNTVVKLLEDVGTVCDVKDIVKSLEEFETPGFRPRAN